MDLTVIITQAMSGITAAIFLFLTAVGLSLIFGVVRVLNFAHGSFYMIGAYAAYQMSKWLGTSDLGFWAGALGAALVVMVIGIIIERLLLRHLYGKDELFQLLLTYALVLILADGVKAVWGVEQVSVARPPALVGAVSVLGATFPLYNLAIIGICLLILFILWIVIQKTSVGRIVRAASMDREMVGALGVNVSWLFTSVFAAGSFLAGLGGALVAPVTAITLGMDAEMIIAAFIAVVIGGLGSFWGTLIGAVIYGQVLSFGILLMPRFSLFAVFALMAVILVVRPYGLLGDRAASRA
jgi:branched-subunit amino acid ABC-type transport system permease component